MHKTRTITQTTYVDASSELAEEPRSPVLTRVFGSPTDVTLLGAWWAMAVAAALIVVAATSAFVLPSPANWVVLAAGLAASAGLGAWDMQRPRAWDTNLIRSLMLSSARVVRFSDDGLMLAAGPMLVLAKLVPADVKVRVAGPGKVTLGGKPITRIFDRQLVAKVRQAFGAAPALVVVAHESSELPTVIPAGKGQSIWFISARELPGLLATIPECIEVTDDLVAEVQGFDFAV